MKSFLYALGFFLLAPIVGGLLAGIDRRITARMQSRFGPPLLQPFYDVFKLFEKETIVVRRSQNFYIWFFLLFAVFTGCLFFAGGDILLVIFGFTLAEVFLVLGAFKASSAYGAIGAERELIQMMAVEPMVILMAVGFYLATGSFSIYNIAANSEMLIKTLPGIFFGLVYILTIKLRKSPFDLSTSHHAHQEIVKGLTIEFSGPGLGLIEIAHWYEKILLLGFVYLFFATNPLWAILAVAVTYFFEMIIDNVFARYKWQKMLKMSWVVTVVFGLGNIIFLYVLSR